MYSIEYKGLNSREVQFKELNPTKQISLAELISELLEDCDAPIFVVKDALGYVVMTEEFVEFI